MSLAREVVALFETLRSSDDPPDWFSNDAVDTLMRSAKAAPVLARMKSVRSPERALKHALQALDVQYGALQPRLLDATFVATFPGGTPIGARPTELVIGEMLLSARTEVLALGYEFTHDETLRLLCDCANRGVAVTVISDRKRLDKDRVRAAWPTLPRPILYVDRERQSALPYAKMHCKTLLVDHDDLLVTSANFTLHGLRGNIEFGVRLRGAPAREARDVFSHLVRSGLLEEVCDLA